MTDTSSLANTHSTTEPYPVAAYPLNSPVPNGTVLDSILLDDDEPYTIKCICTFQDDDGNTVFCERCETWQHIECYYPGRGVPEVHNCTDCEPRPLDAKRATERQKRLREQSDGGDRKAKRTGTKTQKKKPREAPLDQVNGSSSHQHHQHNHHPQQPPQQQNHHNPHRSESASRDQPPVKKPKMAHKTSTSVSSLSAVSLLPSDQRKRSGSATNNPTLSPTKPPIPSIPLYSREFLHLYEHDEGHVGMENNLFVNLTLTTELTSWVKDPWTVTGRSPQDIFSLSDGPLDPTRWPPLIQESITDDRLELDGKHPTWRILKTETNVHKDEIVGEIKGKIGRLGSYCEDPRNRWLELRHPQPFVFFHPQLPIYIDSREEGTVLRYIRRSCRPNVTMKTFITNEVEYHFCFVANQEIPANSEITAMWYLDPKLFSSFNGLVKQETSDGFQEAAACISTVLAHFGGCACEPQQNCLLVNVDRRRNSAMKPVNVKRKKSKTKQVISPLGTGRSTSNPRATSEGAKRLDDDDQADSRSTSGSARGQTHSRDLTPTLQIPPESGFGDSELSARDKRKIAAVEKKFEQLEQDKRKKKRTSGQSTQTTPTATISKQSSFFSNTNSHSKPPHLDMSTVRDSYSPPYHLPPGPTSVHRYSSPRKSSGSNTPVFRSPLGRPHYVDSETQTELDEYDAQPTPPASSQCRRSFVPLTQRLITRCHQDRIRFECATRQRQAEVCPMPVGKDMSNISSRQAVEHPPDKPGPPVVNGLDVEMKDADTEMTTAKSRPSDATRAMGGSQSQFILPSTPGDATPGRSPGVQNSVVIGNVANGFRSDLRVQLPPSNFASFAMAGAPESATPTSIQSPSTLIHPSAQTPGSSITAASPIKKKISLGDYLSRKGTMTTPTSEKTQAQATAMLPPQKSPSRRQSITTVSLSSDGRSQAITDTDAQRDITNATDIMKDPSKQPSAPLNVTSTSGPLDHARFQL
ncbi:hypothetical protein V8E54_006509 [Elaphomyces granulatus]